MQLKKNIFKFIVFVLSDAAGDLTTKLVRRDPPLKIQSMSIVVDTAVESVIPVIEQNKNWLKCLEFIVWEHCELTLSNQILPTFPKVEILRLDTVLTFMNIVTRFPQLKQLFLHNIRFEQFFDATIKHK